METRLATLASNIDTQRTRGDICILCSSGAHMSHNLITDSCISSLVTMLTGNTGPDMLYIAVGIGTTAPASADTALVTEIYRDIVSSSWSPNAGTARLLLVVGPTVGNGDWCEVGIFNAPERRVSLSSCEGTSGWESDGTLTQDASVVHQGAASVRAQMVSGGTVPFASTGLDPSYGTLEFGTADYLQFWFRSTYDQGTLTVRLGSGTGDYYQWSWNPGTTDVYTLFNQQIASGSATGSPDINSITYMQLSHTDQGTAFTEHLDYITLFGTSGTAMTRGTISVTKSHNTVKNIFYSLKLET